MMYPPEAADSCLDLIAWLAEHANGDDRLREHGSSVYQAYIRALAGSPSETERRRNWRRFVSALSKLLEHDAGAHDSQGAQRLRAILHENRDLIEDAPLRLLPTGA